MSDIRPLPPLPDLNDPTATQVLVRTIGASTDFRALGAEATSCSIVVVDDRPTVPATESGDDATEHASGSTIDVESPVLEQIVAEASSTFNRVRPEVLVMTSPNRPTGRSTNVARGRQPYRLRFHVTADDGYCSALMEGVEHAANEFIVVPRSGSEPLLGLAAVLGHMWLDGADMAVVPAVLPMSSGAPVGDDVISMLPRWLGLEECRDTSATIVMRRWFAKWVFNEIDGLPDPVDELADRIRLLGSTVLLMKWIDG